MDCLLTNLYWNNAPISGAVGDSSTKVFSKPISNNSYASDAASDAKPKVFGHGRISNATIESFFKILKHSILRHQTNLRPGEFLLKIYATINARLKANQHDIPQTGSKRKRRRTKKKDDQIDTTVLAEKWKNQGTTTAPRGVYFTKLTELTLTAADIRNRLREKLE
jgi:hypothetical protein